MGKPPKGGLLCHACDNLRLGSEIVVKHTVVPFFPNGPSAKGHNHVEPTTTLPQNFEPPSGQQELVARPWLWLSQRRHATASQEHHGWQRSSWPRRRLEAAPTWTAALLVVTAEAGGGSPCGRGGGWRRTAMLVGDAAEAGGSAEADGDARRDSGPWRSAEAGGGAEAEGGVMDGVGMDGGSAGR
ncbi:hypothetical protein OsJ_03665 [Oryza sativa Japonica Group]|uniref:Uncharacterized protein n=1 Tax=Oryza sativa subsp. japonica TaxID=39947 RepID=B9ETB4_ORYSJ|nr:hypothetical protein OsJ_03665 [Oryza sativa Japonica Group]